MDVVLRAIIFDLDGVLIDSEPLHFSAFNKTLSSEGASLSSDLYKEKYLSLDDRDAFTRFYQEEKKQPLDFGKLNDLMNKKT